MNQVKLLRLVNLVKLVNFNECIEFIQPMKLVRIVIILGDNSDPKWFGLSESWWVGLQICQGCMMKTKINKERYIVF